jgi:hypothetical protein
MSINFVVLQKTDKVNNCPRGENSPNLAGHPVTCCTIFLLRSTLRFLSGLPDFLDAINQNGGKYTNLPQHYQMAIKYTKWP